MVMKKENKKVVYPLPLKVVQFLNYFATITSLFLAILYLVAPSTVMSEMLDSHPTNRFASAALFLAIAGLMGFVTYAFRQRKSNATAYFVVSQFIIYALGAIVNHLNNYPTSLSSQIFEYVGAAVITAYLLFSTQVKNYFDR